MNESGRDVILVVGATGSLGIPIVSELRRRGHKVRLLGRSWESFVKAGYVSDKEDEKSGIDLVVCKDVASRKEFPDQWFQDVFCVVCVARPRSLKEDDSASYRPMIDNLADAVCTNGVPRLLLHGIPYLEDNPFGLSPTMKILKGAETSARERFEGCADNSSITVSRICEMSEIGHLAEAVTMLGFYPCAYGYDPLLHPISPPDFATAIVDCVEDSTCIKRKLLVGGPRQITWRELGQTISRSSEHHIHTITLPLFVFRVIDRLLDFLSVVFPGLKGLCLSLKLTLIPMSTNTANDVFDCVGSDDVEEFLGKHMRENKVGWVHKRVFGSNYQEPTEIRKRLDDILPSPRSLARVLGFFAACDGSVAIFKPSFVGSMQNLNVEGATVDRFLVLEFGIAAVSISAMTFLSLRQQADHDVPRQAIAAGIAMQLLLTIWVWYTDASMKTIDINLSSLHAFNGISLVTLMMLLANKRHSLAEARALSYLTLIVGLVHYLQPAAMKYTLGLDVAKLGEKTLAHSRQASMYYIGSGVQMLALSHGVKPERAAGLICLAWFLCLMDLWLIAKVADVFELSQSSRTVNLMWPIWSGVLAVGILCR